VCSLDNFGRLIFASVSNTLEKQGIADPSDISAAAGQGNKESNLKYKNLSLPSFPN